ncbi:hypothetical protein BDN72DRAFT_845399 [Pluteus cervinus]|uniref:Uncharacterized protein n=1 Tax=Pluteus cervinus TaxID=181527 RepID=A0ACD3AIM5_9AGAR|nr:hypothetical protein BDN72DRAFT_845399 [Pluteus cervinus]
MDPLPSDIIETILNEVDHTTLSACSTVSRQFLPFCRSRIFKLISISRPRLRTGKPAMTRCSRLLQMFRETPDLVEYVRIVKLRLDASTRASMGPIVSEDLCEVLGKLKRLTNFFLISSASDPMEWKSLGSNVQVALMGCFHLPTMDFLSIEYFQGIPTSVFNGATLTRFKFWSTTWSTSTASLHSSNLSQDLVRPTFLQISASYKRVQDRYHFLYDFLAVPPPCPFNFENLTSLDVEVTNANKAQLTRVIGFCSSGLRKLMLRLDDDDPLDLSPLVSLEILSMKVIEPFFIDNILQTLRAFRAMIKTLATCKSAARLRTISLYFRMDRAYFSQFPWGDLDDAVYDIASLERNTPLTLELQEDVASLYIDKRLRYAQAIRDQLPKLVRKGVVS